MSSRLLVICLSIALVLSGCTKDSPTNLGQSHLVSPLLIVVDTSGTGNYNVRWTASRTALGYELQEDTTFLFPNSSVIYSGPDTSVAISNRPFGVVLYYRVRAFNNSERSAWSASRFVAIVQANGPRLFVNPGSLDFGYSPVDSTKTVALTITNMDSVTALVSFSLSDPSVFNLIDSSRFFLGPGYFRPVHVRFTPHSVSTFSAVLSILSNNVANSHVSLWGTSAVTSGPPDTIRLLSPTPQTMTTVGGPGPTTIIIAFQVRDSLNRPLGLAYQHTVSFILTGPPIGGGAYVSPQSALTDSSGMLYTTVNSGVTTGTLLCVARLIRTTDGRVIQSQPYTVHVQ